MSNSTACEIGMSAAPHNPCSSRNVTICVSVCASPHSAEAIVKPITDSRNRRLRPI
jgi:hypothetical protein